MTVEPITDETLTEITDRFSACKGTGWPVMVEEECFWGLIARIERAEVRVKVLEAALQPFAKAGGLFPEPLGTVEVDQLIYGPAAGREYAICGEDLRRAHAALEGE